MISSMLAYPLRKAGLQSAAAAAVAAELHHSVLSASALYAVLNHAVVPSKQLYAIMHLGDSATSQHIAGC